MKKTILYTLLFIGLNVLLFLALVFIGETFIESKRDYDFSSLFFILAGSVILLILELIVGAILAARPGTKEPGKGLLLAAAIGLLFGLSVCSSM